jgi:sulfite exporter TauE/SafE
MSSRNPGRLAYVLAALLLCAYGANVLIGKGVASFGWQLPHAGDIPEFLSVFAAMVLFVTGLMRNEAGARPPDNP